MADPIEIVPHLRNRLINYFCENPTKVIKTVNICRSVDQPKKIVNSILYKLQREGILKKVVESPPAWQYVNNNIELQEFICSMPLEYPKNNLAEQILLALQESNGCLTPKEISERLGNTETAVRLALFSLEMKGQIVKVDVNLYAAAPQDSKSSIITSDKKTLNQSCHKVQDTADAIVQYIKQCQGPTSSTNIAKALGYRTKKGVNPILYHLQTKQILKKVKDVPPLWYLADGISHVENTDDSKILPPNPTIVQPQQKTLPSLCPGESKSSPIAPPTQLDQPELKAPKPATPTTLNITLSQLPTQNIVANPPLIDTGLNGLNIYTHNGTMKNPISVFNEYGQRNHIDTKIEVIYSEGPSHNPRFTAAAFLGDEKIAEASEKTKKESKRLAAEIAVTKLSGRYALNNSEKVEPPEDGNDDLIENEIHIKPYIRETSSVIKERSKEEIILELLQEHDVLTSKEINARSSLSESAVKLVLNQLLFQGLVKKVDGRPPLWTLIKSPEEIKSLEAQTLEIIMNIINFLRNSKEDATTQEILDALGFSGKKQLTPLLHRLQTKNIIIKVPNIPPLWRLRDPYHKQDPNLEEVIKANAPDNIPFENRIIQAMAKHSKPALSTNEVAEALGLKNQLEIGAILLELNKKGAISKVYDVPPTWSLPDRLDEEYQPSPAPLSTKEVAKLFALSCRVSGPQTLYISEVPDPQKMKNSPNPEEKPLPQSVIDVLNSESFAALMKNPVSAFHEYGQRNRIEAKVEVVSHHGPSHDPRFKAVATLGDEPLGEAWDKTKKDAKRQAAELAVRNLVAKGKMPKLENPLPVLEFPPDNGGNGTGGSLRRFDVVAALSHKAFNEKVLEVPEYMGGRKVLAALVMFTGEKDIDGTVISLGTGNRCITGLHLSQDGLVVNDSHAEVITRRGFMRYMYNQLQNYRPGKEHPILEPSATGDKLKVKDGITFHLYISTAPCGDGALFAHNPKPGEPMDAPESEDGKHHPIYSKSLQGLLRAKMEAGEGTIPIDNDHHGLQNWDGILMGERLRTMSCSDKIARWNVVGLQGALLNLFIEPIYLSSITLGNLYHHGHLSRAVCCRLDGNKGEPMLSELLPPPFRHVHPALGKMALYAPPRETEKTKPHSINWCLGDEKPELISGVTGTVNGVGSTSESRLCKAAMFQNFKEACRIHGKEEFLDQNYRNTKMLAKDYQKAKFILFDRFKKMGRGTWIRKPIEEEEFV